MDGVFHYSVPPVVGGRKVLGGHVSFTYPTGFLIAGETETIKSSKAVFCSVRVRSEGYEIPDELSIISCADMKVVQKLQSRRLPA